MGLGLAAGNLVRAKQKARVSLQLFSVREECGKNLPMTLSQVRGLGYEAVEFAGFYGWKAADVSRLLDNNGLQCCGSHTPLDQLTTAGIADVIAFNRTIGNTNIIVPGFPAEYHSSEGWKRGAERLNELSAQLEAAGLHIGYHNHADEFQGHGEQMPWHVLFTRTRPQVILQLDTGNARIGGADPADLVRRYPGRAKSVHVKDFLPGQPDVLLGTSNYDWNSLLRILQTVGRTEWYIVEHESRTMSGIEGARASLERFRQILSRMDESR